MIIRKAERKKSKLRLGICGVSGSGKTWSSLEIATGIGGKIGFIDTESGRGELYANDFDYDIIRLDAPYSTERYIEAIKTFEKNEYDTIIIDSLSHAWFADGGILSIVDNSSGNSKFTSGWKVATPKYNSLVESLITSKCHIIATLRVKTEYIQEMNDKGKLVPRKIGLTPVQRDGLDYEFTIFMDIESERNIAHVTKDNTKLFNQQFIKPTKEMGEKLIEWLNDGRSEEEINSMELEEFKKIILPDSLDLIRKCDDLTTLKDIYQKLFISYARKFPEEFKEITFAKDLKKEELSTPKLSFDSNEDINQ